MEVTLKVGRYGSYLLEAETGETMLVHYDADIPHIAEYFGFDFDPSDYPNGYTTELIAAAMACLDDHEGESFDDPGYFDRRR